MKIVKINPTFKRFLVFLKKYFYIVIAVVIVAVVAISIIESGSSSDTSESQTVATDAVYGEQVNFKIDLSGVDTQGSTNDLMTVLVSNYGMYLQENSTRESISEKLQSEGMDPYYEYGDEGNDIHFDVIKINRHSSSIYAYVYISSDNRERTELVADTVIDLLKDAPSDVSLNSEIIVSEIKIIEPEGLVTEIKNASGDIASFWFSAKGIAAFIFAIILGLIIILIMSAISSKIYLETEVEDTYGIKFIDIKNERAMAYKYGNMPLKSIKVIKLFESEIIDLKQEAFDIIQFNDLEVNSEYHYWIAVKLGRNKLIDVNNIMEELKVYDIEIEGYITV